MSPQSDNSRSKHIGLHTHTNAHYTQNHRTGKEETKQYGVYLSLP